MSEPTLLDTLLEVIDTATDDGWDQPATLWFAAADPTADPGGITIGHKIVDGHPYHHLLGFTAPDDWTVLGVTCCGWAGSLDADVPPSMQEGRRRVRQTFLVGRSGATASTVHFQDGGEPFTTREAGVGRMLDLLLRCLGLPTAPPDVDTPVLYTAWWLDNVIGVGRESPKRLTWKQVSDQHPAMRMLRAAGERALTGDVTLAGRTLANVFDWPRLRELCIERAAPGLVDADLAEWMDEGMLCRHLLGELPPLGELMHEALGHVTPATGERLYAAVAELLGGRAAA